MRDKSGRFIKDHSGNAGGRPKDEPNIARVRTGAEQAFSELKVKLTCSNYAPLRRRRAAGVPSDAKLTRTSYFIQASRGLAQS